MIVKILVFLFSEPVAEASSIPYETETF
jgi:hypothetical protein